MLRQLATTMLMAGLVGQMGLAQDIQLARFDIDVTPPVGFPMAYDPVKRVDEPGLRCRGIVLLGAGQPIVLCAVDWIGIGNEAHDAFRETIAQAAGTVRERVAVQTLHQHDAPRCDFTAERLLRDAGVVDLGALQGGFARDVLQRLQRAVKDSLTAAVPVSHAAIGEAVVEKVASNRRIQDDTGRVVQTRYTTCRDPALRALPEGIIDPVVTTLSFWSDEQPVAVLSYYACHPQSYYRTGVPSPDFPGLARLMRGQDVPTALHVHFNGAGGNIGAGKYNDGAKSNRLMLARRVADGMRRSLESAEKFELSADDIGWAVTPVKLPLGDHLQIEQLQQSLTSWKTKDYWGSPEQLAFALRCRDGRGIDLSCLRVGDARVLHMPGELFVEYQLAAKKLRPQLHVAMAAYGDYGPGYIGTAESYGQGGYETSERASKVGPGVERVLMDGVKVLLKELDEAPDYAAELPRIPPTAPAQALDTFQVADGYELQLVAAEPLVGSPVAVEWDANGRMYVCEMRGYSENRDDQISTIGLLVDEDDDGTYDRRTTFAAGLNWPTAIFPFDGGLFVGDAPNVFYLKDTDGDGVADVRKTVLTGLGTSNVQGLMNSMRWDLDGGIHIACSSVGGEVMTAGASWSPVNIRGRDILLDPRSGEFRLTSGAAQHGMCFDDWGRKFVSSNSDHIQQVMYEDHLVTRNPYCRPPGARVSIAADGPQAAVFRISPVEPWRIVRTRLRVAGTVPGPVEGGGRAAGYFTGATGITIYRGDAWPNADRGLAIVGDVGSNLVHRKKLTGSGLPFRAERMDERSEFVASADIWFRPSQFANAPDGSLYVIDTCREVIEHPASLPPGIKEHLDLTAGRDRGRIYRVVPEGWKHRPTPQLAGVSSGRLVELLSHPNAWHRETAARLLFERQDADVIADLTRMVRQSTVPLGRMHALYVLAGMHQLSADLLRRALHDDHPQVRRHAVRLADRHQLAAPLVEQLLPLASDDSRAVRMQLAYTLSGVEHPEKDEALAAILRQDPGRWTQLAVHSAVPAGAAGLLERLLVDSQWYTPAADSFLQQLIDQVGAQKSEADFDRVLQALNGLDGRHAALALPLYGSLLKWADRNQNRGLTQARARIRELLTAARRAAADHALEAGPRARAVSSLRFAAFHDVQELLTVCLQPQQPQEIREAALQTLDEFREPEAAAIIVQQWQTFSPRLRSLAVEMLFVDQDRISLVLEAVRQDQMSLADLPRDRLQRVTHSSSRQLAGQAQALLAAWQLSPRHQVVQEYLTALSGTDGAAQDRLQRGRGVFRKQCASCHRLEGVGHELGPSLATMAARGPESILVNVLDPNREVNPQYVNYVAALKSGRSVTGMIVGESSGSLTLRRAEGASDTLLRSDIEQLQSTGKSLMPEGLEKTIDPEAMADLLAYLMHGQPDRAAVPPAVSP